jgi:hypothetical protein
MPRPRKAQAPAPVPVCQQPDGRHKLAYATRAEAEQAAEIAASRTYGDEFVVYRCGNHWHIAHKTT